MKTKTIRVTKEDIKNGKRNSAHCCPIAFAAQRCLGWKYAWVLHESMDNFDSKQKVYLPEKATQFILDFDSGNKVKPFSFKVKIKVDND